MGQTITEKVLAGHADVDSAAAGDVLTCRPDLIMGHDLTAPHAINVFRQIGIGKVRDPDKVVLVQDHFQPAKDIQSATLSRSMREFAKEMDVGHFYEVGWGGICHILMLEKGLVRPGMLIAGADSHTVTVGALGAVGYGVGATDLAALWALGEFWLEVPRSRKIVLEGRPQRFIGGKDIALSVLGSLGKEGAMNEALEYEGGAFEHLSVSDRITIANMSAETGACTVVIPPDEKVLSWLSGRVDGPCEPVLPDADASYVRVHAFNISELEPMVAVPDNPADVHPVREVEGVRVDQVFLGSCANGSLEDLRRFARVLGNNSFDNHTRVLVTPATQEVFREALNEGIIGRIVDAGGAVGTPSCGPCLGGYGGVLGPGDVCLSTSNRNFKGRMGHRDSKVYLAGPEVAAATAVRGKITHPADVAK